MRIGPKLVAGFIVVVVLMATMALYSVNLSQDSLQESVGKSSVFLSEEMLAGIDETIYLKIENLQVYAGGLLIQEAVSKSNL
jgi:CHASE3 domain sensor protein